MSAMAGVTDKSRRSDCGPEAVGQECASYRS
jgi:hypothetical protein